jgi:hypothetical protein
MGVSAFGKVILFQQKLAIVDYGSAPKSGDRSNPYKSRVVHTLTLTGVG